jgi:hypothetical protein
MRKVNLIYKLHIFVNVNTKLTLSTLSDDTLPSRYSITDIYYLLKRSYTSGRK